MPSAYELTVHLGQQYSSTRMEGNIATGLKLQWFGADQKAVHRHSGQKRQLRTRVTEVTAYGDLATITVRLTACIVCLSIRMQRSTKGMVRSC